VATLYGHSLAGLFCLNLLFEQPGSFRSFVASSPSIWWNDRAVLAGEAAFADRIVRREAAPRLLVTMGGAEQSTPAKPPPGMDETQMQALVEHARMVDNARELVQRLEGLDGGPGYLARFHAFEGDDHTMALAASIARALAFALRD